MKRLTMKDKNGYYLKDKSATITWNSLIGENRYRGEAIDRLAAYEDTGLEPEEISKIREDVENGYLKSTARRYGVSVDRLRELAQADREDAVHIGACGFCEHYQMDKFCCGPDWVEDGYAIIRKPKDYCTKFKKANWVDEVWGENGCPSCPGYKPTTLKAREQDG